MVEPRELLQWGRIACSACIRHNCLAAVGQIFVAQGKLGVEGLSSSTDNVLSILHEEILRVKEYKYVRSGDEWRREKCYPKGH